MSSLVSILKDNPLLLLFIVAGIGYPIGRLRVGGANLGIAAVLFVGLGVGALHPDLKLPESIYTLGLVLFVYTIGLSSGSVFFSNFRSRGLQYNLLVAGSLVIAALAAAGAHLLLGFKATLTAGMFAGSLTNTPALAGVLERIKNAFPAGQSSALQAEPVISYSLTYPIGVLGMLLAIYLAQRLWKVDYEQEAHLYPDCGVGDRLESQTICITQTQSLCVEDLIRLHQWNVIFGRLCREEQLGLVSIQTIFQAGDLVSLIGNHQTLESVTHELGENCGRRLDFDLSKYDKRRMFVSNLQVAGRRLKDLPLFSQFGATLTRLRRGDIETLPHGDTVLCLGDQVRVVAPHEQMERLAAFFGDSYRGVSEIDILTFSLGLALGLLVGMIPIPLTGGLVIQLGLAGGPLLVSLCLGAIGRSRSLVWQLPYSANLTLRQVGLVLFLAGIGTRSGYVFIDTLRQGNGLGIFFVGALLTCGTALLTLWVGYRWLHIPLGLLVGILAGLQTQPAVLGFGLEQTKNELPNIGYTAVYPIAMIFKIVLAQVLLVLFL